MSSISIRSSLIAAVKKMNEEGLLLDGTKIEGPFSMLIGAPPIPL